MMEGRKGGKMEDWKIGKELGFSSFAIIPSFQYSNIPAAK